MSDLKTAPLPNLRPAQTKTILLLRLSVGREVFVGFGPRRKFAQLARLAVCPSLSGQGRRSGDFSLLEAGGIRRRPSDISLSIGGSNVKSLNAVNVSPHAVAKAFGRAYDGFGIRHDVGGVRFGQEIAAMTVPTALETVVIRGHSQNSTPQIASGDPDHEDLIGSEAGENRLHSGVTKQSFPNGGAKVDGAVRQDSDATSCARSIDVSCDRRELYGTSIEMGQVRSPQSADHLGHVGILRAAEPASLPFSEDGGTSPGESRAEGRAQAQEGSKRLRTEGTLLTSPAHRGIDDGGRVFAAWDHWTKLGEPKLLVAPMVDQSELPFRMLCRKYGATAAYTPMLHSRLFAQDAKYRSTEFSTCAGDRPLFVQFCANNPDTLLEAARLVESQCDYIDINLGCPQRIAKKGNYGAFLMDNLPLIKSLVSKLASNLTTPVSCKIRVFSDLEKTLAYARMIEEAGSSLLAVHGRTRDQKNGKEIRADWDAIKAVKAALRIPVLANGNIRWLEDVHACIAYTGVDGVLSAESLLENPALFGGYRTAHSVENGSTDGTLVVPELHNAIDELLLLQEYLQLCECYPVPMRMVRGHVHKLLGKFWFKRNPDIREELNRQYKLTIDWLKDMVTRLAARGSDNSIEKCKVEEHDEKIVLEAV